MAAAEASSADARANADAGLTVVAHTCWGMVHGDPAPLLAAADHLETIGRPLSDP
jgi:hypothetical protein